MKKLILLLAVASTGLRCGEDHIYYRSEWNIKDLTNRTIKIISPPYSDFRHFVISENNSWYELYSFAEYDNEPSFEMMLDCWRGWADKNISFEVLSDDGTILVKWNYSDKDLPGKQFFNKSSWKHSFGRSNEDIWTFEILPEDIAP